MIIKDKMKLEEKCSPVSVKEGEEIGVRLLHELRESENGMLIVWPSILYHEVPPTKEKRMCISMNFKHKEKIK